MIQIDEISGKSLLIHMKFNGQNLATGTGFVLNSAKGPVLVTNRHNLTGRWQKDNKPLSKNGGIPNKVEIFHHATSRLGHWVPKTEPLYSDQDSELPRWIEHPVLGAKADFVALPLTQLDTVHYIRTVLLIPDNI